MIEHDYLVLGGGHNGLVAAGYMCKAGMDVGIIEGRSFYGGGAQTRELSVPGFMQETDSVAHGFIQGNPVLQNDELGLISKYGLNYFTPEEQFANIFEDGTWWGQYVDLDRTCESIAKVSEKDAEGYRNFVEWAGKLTPMLGSSLYSPCPEFGQIISLLNSDPNGQELARALFCSADTIVNEFFTDEYVKVGLLKIVTEAMMSPWQDGTGSYLFLMVPVAHFEPHKYPYGGGIELPRALVDCINEHGGTLYLNSDITHIEVENGRVVGCTCANGEVFRARKAVLSTLHVKQMFGGENPLIDPEHYSETIGHNVQRCSGSSASAIVANYALKELPHYTADEECNKFLNIELLPLMEGFRRHWDDCAHGVVPGVDDKVCYAACHSVFDKSRTPNGEGATVQLYDPVPYELADGGHERWDEIEERVEDEKLAWWRRFTDNVTDENIIGRDIRSPLGLARWDKNYVDGENSGMGAQLYQYMSNRPIPQLGQHRVPGIENLYIGGMTSHPGAGVCGGGRVVAQVLMEDEGIDFDAVAEAAI